MLNQKFLPPFAALRAFEAVGRLGGIRRAAKELSIDHAVVSRHIRSLEEWVGVELVLRRSSGNELTALGQSYHDEVSRALTAIMTATNQIMKPDSGLKLRIWCMPGFAWLWLAMRLNEFMSENEDIEIDFRPSDTFPDFRRHEVDGDIRYLRDWEVASLPSLIHRLDFARPTVIPVASEQYIKDIAPINGADEFLQLSLLHEEDDSEWRNWLLAQHCALGDRLPGVRLWHAHLTINAARQGRGIALANRFLLANDLKEGRLLEVRPASGCFHPVAFGSYTILAREDRWSTPSIARFRKWLVEASAQFLASN